MLIEIIMASLTNVFIVITGCYIINKIIPNEKKLSLTWKTTSYIVLAATVTNFALMFFAVKLPNGIQADLRFIVFMLLAYYIGAQQASLTALVACGIRIFIGGGLNEATAFGVFCTLAVALPLIFIAVKLRKSKLNQIQSFLLLNTTGVTVYTATLFLYYGYKPFVFLIGGSIFIVSFVALFSINFIINDMLTTRRLLREEVEYAYVDFLTGLYNVRAFSNRTKEFARSPKVQKLAIFILDIDFFKKVNDTYGHASGDRVLQSIAQTMKNKVVIPENLFRVGGEEFCYLLPNVSNEKAFEVGEEIRLAIESHPIMLSSSETIQATISIGIASGEKSRKQLHKLYQYADKALYEAKHTGRNKVVLCSQDEIEEPAAG
ncbi:GGDEF domain-containing protein [Listeria fleischmannii]|uniref:GGDEF domain-containing protein n=1 Tax=Listeria fleischmannii TaxID=1069827 RepID=UPI001623B1AB|nr:GGDEF domain-containing protein [Listeria fleischmannii]MBC1419466.1 diguanylate cyclase [Listeria fleischmannii]